MDRMVQQNSNTTSFTLPEMWQFQETNSNANATSFGEFAGSVQMNMNLDIDMMNREHDPMIMDHCNGEVSLKKRREDVDSVYGKCISANTDGNAMDESDIKRMKTKGAKEHSEPEQEGEAYTNNAAEQTAKPSEPPKQDYIHVRARRGQATDSHSLAERARREKISERMKILQDLVPGCNKVIGKALVLDEIINYIQSLQRQVEFLSMKLEAVNSRVPQGIDGYHSKEFAQQQAFDGSSLGFSSQAARDYNGGATPEWLHMQLGGGFERTS